MVVNFESIQKFFEGEFSQQNVKFADILNAKSSTMFPLFDYSTASGWSTRIDDDLVTINSFFTSNGLTPIDVSVFPSLDFSTYLNCGEAIKIWLYVHTQISYDIGGTEFRSTKHCQIDSDGFNTSVGSTSFYTDNRKSLANKIAVQQVSMISHAGKYRFSVPSPYSGKTFYYELVLSDGSWRYTTGVSPYASDPRINTISYVDILDDGSEGSPYSPALEIGNGHDSICIQLRAYGPDITGSNAEKGFFEIIPELSSSELAEHGACMQVVLNIRDSDGGDILVSRELCRNGVYSPFCGSRPSGIVSTIPVGDLNISVLSPRLPLSKASGSNFSISGSTGGTTGLVTYYKAIKAFPIKEDLTYDVPVPRRARIPNPVNIRVTGSVEGYTNIVASEGQGSYNPEITVTGYEHVSLTASFLDAVALYDSYDATDVVNVTATEKLSQYILEHPAMLDSYFRAYMDFTADIVCDYVLDEIFAASRTGVFRPQYGIDENTLLMGGSIRSYLNNEHPRQEELTQAITWSRALIDLRIALFEAMDNTFTGTDYLSSLTTWIQNRIDDVYRTMSTIAQTTVVADLARKALLLSYSDLTNTYSKVNYLISQAIKFGATNASAAYDIICSIAPEGILITDRADVEELLSDILLGTPYHDSYNYLRHDKPGTTQVPYWATFNARMGSSIITGGGVDSEIATAPSGALFIYPAVFTTTFHSDGFDIPAPQMVIPFPNSYLIVGRTSIKGVFTVSWYARFNGGTDLDAYQAISDSYIELQQFSNVLAKAFTGIDTTITWPTLPGQEDLGCYVNGSFMTKAEFEANLGAGVLITGSSIAGYVAGAALAGSVGGPPGALIAGTAAAIYSIWQFNSLQNSGSGDNLNYKLSEIVNLDKSKLKITDGGPLGSLTTGKDAADVVGSLIGWFVYNGGALPIIREGVDFTSRIIGALAPGDIPAKFMYVGEYEDYTPLILTATAAISVIAASRYLKFEKTRPAHFIPGLAAVGTYTVASTALSKAMEKKVASESSLIELSTQLSETFGDIQVDQSTLIALTNTAIQLIGEANDSVRVVDDKIDQLAKTIGQDQNPTFYR